MRKRELATFICIISAVAIVILMIVPWLVDRESLSSAAALGINAGTMLAVALLGACVLEEMD